MARPGIPVPETEWTPALPMGRRVELPGRGTTFVREVPGPPGAPTVVLVHGWIASAGLNWFRCFAPLSDHFRVLAPDMRGHGRGIKSRRRFTLSACADDIAALCEVEGVEDAIICGYSMGGPIALLTWKRHPELASGLVLGATSFNVVPGFRDQLFFVGVMAALAGSTRAGQQVARIPLRSLRGLRYRGSGAPRPDSFRRWAAAEVGRHDFRQLIEAGQAVGTFNARKWVKDIDVPTTVMITGKDRGIHPSAQLDLALAIPGAQVMILDEGHMAPMLETFGPRITDACLAVATRL